MKTKSFLEQHTSHETLHEKYPDAMPREKLLSSGVSALSKSDLIALLLGTGKKGLNVLDLADEILRTVNYNLDTLARYDVKQIMKLFAGKGIGKAKAITLVAAIELGSRRVGDNPNANITTMRSSRDIFNYMYPRLMNLAHEECHIILMNHANKIISSNMLSKGGTAATVIDIKILMRQILLQSASAVAVAHNHPSGNLNPSPEDLAITRRIADACKTIGISFLDHVIIGNGEYFSFTDEGLL